LLAPALQELPAHSTVHPGKGMVQQRQLLQQLLQQLLLLGDVFASIFQSCLSAVFLMCQQLRRLLQLLLPQSPSSKALEKNNCHAA